MFNNGKKSYSNDRIDTLIGKNTTLEGTVRAEGTIRVDGSIKGEVIVTGNIIVGEGCTIKGNVKAENAHISGTIEGNITASAQLHLAPTAKLIGDMIVKNVIIDEGAVFIGNCKSTAQDTAPKSEDSTSEM